MDIRKTILIRPARKVIIQFSVVKVRTLGSIGFRRPLMGAASDTSRSSPSPSGRKEEE